MTKPIIKINLDQAKAQILSALPHNADRTRILKGLGAATFAQWKKLAMHRLRSTARDYVAGLEHNEDGGKVVIQLNGELPNMIEQGWGGGDMRQWMLSSPKAKEGENGPYLVIPFRHGTPGTSGRNVGRPMPPSIHMEAKALSHTFTRPGAPVGQHGGQTTVHGQRLHPHKNMRSQARDILQRKEKPYHASSIYMGMIKKGKHVAGGSVQTTGYSTFRTISMHTRDAQRHWVHPGIKARNISLDVHKYLGKIVSGVVAASMKGQE